jgi:aspartate kinase
MTDRALDLERAIVSEIRHSEHEVLFDLWGLEDRPGVAAAIFEAATAEDVNVDTILQNAAHGPAALSFSVPIEDAPATRRALARAAETIGPFEHAEISDLGKVSIVGAGLRSHPHVVVRMFRALADAGINIRMISMSPITVQCLVDRALVERAVSALHEAFPLDPAPPSA